MDEKMKQEMGELAKLIGDTWKGVAISAGVSAGFFHRLSHEKPSTIQSLVKELGYDPEKVEKWLYFMVKCGLVEQRGEDYFLTSKGLFLSPETPVKDIYGMYQLSDFYMTAATHSREAFKTKRSMEALSEGKISRDYQPKVSDNLSMELLQYFKEYQVSPGETLLDVGCGNGSFLRSLHSKLPEVYLTGVDSNLFAIELGKKENIRLGLTHWVKLLVGDAASDLNEFQADSYDWVCAINLFHFYPRDRRGRLVEEMLRIAKKGVCMTEALADASPIVAPANTLMSLLWNDFTGFFREDEVEELNLMIREKYKKYQFNKIPIMQGTSNLVVITKPKN